jgi:hypothetical protein
MNFENMPELRSRIGYFVVWGVMITIGVSMTVYFRHRGWIGSQPPPDLRGGRRRERDADDR